jgi:hypothetical protein
MAITLTEEYRKLAEWMAITRTNLGLGITAKNPRWVQPIQVEQPRCNPDAADEPPYYLGEFYVWYPAKACLVVDIYKYGTTQLLLKDFGVSLVDMVDPRINYLDGPAGVSQSPDRVDRLIATVPIDIR